MATTDIYTIQGSLTPNRSACRFLGGATTCAIRSDAAGVAFKADAAGTICAWVMIPDVKGTADGTILGFGDDNAVEFMQFSIEAGLLTLRSTDATTAQFVSQADAVGFSNHTWHHVAAVQNATSPVLYIDGVAIAHTNDTSTDLTSWGAELGGIDVGFIGTANKAGDGTETEEFTGFISSVRYYNVAKTAAQIKAIYEYEKGQPGTSNDTTGLRNHWKLEDDYLDSGSGADTGTAEDGALLMNSCNPFTSRLGFSTGVILAADTTQDLVKVWCENGIGYALVVQEA
jgi:hypothetical protein